MLYAPERLKRIAVFDRLSRDKVWVLTRSPRRESSNGATSQRARSPERREVPYGDAMRKCSHMRAIHDTAGLVRGILPLCQESIEISLSRTRRSNSLLPSLGYRTALGGFFIDNSCSKPRSR